MAETVAIIGGTGRMGRWFGKFFKEKGYRVIISSRSLKKAISAANQIGTEYAESILNAVNKADIVLLATPIRVTAKIIREISKELKPGTILFDIASIKGDIITAYEEAKALGIRPISVHPLFGPGAKSIKGKSLLIIPIIKDFELIRQVAGIFKGAIVRIVERGEDHDRMMALTLAFPHFLNIIFSKTLLKTDIRELKKFRGTTFTLQLLVAESVLSEDPHLYYAIQSQSDAFLEILDDFTDVVKEWVSIVKTQNRSRFVTNFNHIRNILSKDPDFVQAYERFYQAIESIQV